MAKPLLSRVLYWMVVVCDDLYPAHADDAREAGKDDLPARDHNQGQEAAGEEDEAAARERAEAGSLRVSYGIFRPKSIGPTCNWLEDEIKACARDAGKAILLNQMHETRRFDSRLLPPDAFILRNGQEADHNEEPGLSREPGATGEGLGSEDPSAGGPPSPPGGLKRETRSSSRYRRHTHALSILYLSPTLAGFVKPTPVSGVATGTISTSASHRRPGTKP